MGLLFFLLFFIFAALGVELFGRLECSEENPCQGLGEHAHFANFGMAFLTLFRVATGDNWNGIMKDTLRDECDPEADCVRNCCVSTVIAPIFFVIFVLMAQFVLVNVVVAVLMKHLEESHKQMEDEIDMDTELEREFQQEQEFEEEQAMCLQLQEEENLFQKRPLAKILSLPSNFTYSTPVFENKFNTQRRQTLHYLNQTLRSSAEKSGMFDEKNSISEAVENDELNSVDIGVTERATAARSSIISVQSGTELEGNRKESNLQKKGRRFKKELSLDDQYCRRVQSNLEVKRMSCDNLPWKIDKNESANHVRLKFRDLAVNDDSSIIPVQKSISSEDSIVTDGRESKDELYTLKTNSRLDGGNGVKSFLSVPLLQQRNRVNSCNYKQLFKQTAMEEDQEIDENSLLLPTVSGQHTFGDADGDWDADARNKDKQVDHDSDMDCKVLKSDSSEILRIISERRMFEKREDSVCKSTDTVESSNE